MRIKTEGNLVEIYSNCEHNETACMKTIQIFGFPRFMHQPSLKKCCSNSLDYIHLMKDAYSEMMCLYSS